MKQWMASVLTGIKLVRKGKFTMKFKKNSIIVKSWVSLIVGGIYQLEDVPRLFNLQEAVAAVIAEQTETGEES